MARIVLCIVALVAASVGQQRKTPSAADGNNTQGSAVITVDPSEVTPAPPARLKLDANVSRSGEKGTAQRSRSKASTALDMRPPAVCGRDMNDALDTDKNYIALMEQPGLAALHKRALDCLPLEQSTRALRRTALVLDETRYRLGFSSGFKSGTLRAAELGEAAIDKIHNANETERESIIYDYDALVDRYNSLANEYNNHDAELVNRCNSLVNDYNRLLGLARHLVELPPVPSSFSLMPPPPAREVHLDCTATPLSGNMTTVNCW